MEIQKLYEEWTTPEKYSDELEKLFDEIKVDALGVLPMYKLRKVDRGKAEDTFFMQPIQDTIHNNAHVINTITQGSDDEVLALTNFSVSTPGVKIKCDHALECKMHVDATAFLIIKYGLSLPNIYRRLAMMPDRICLGCKTPSLKMSPMAGKWRCNHCHSHGRSIGFEEGFMQWLNNGSPTRHTHNT
jgi:hypothetical protein